MFVLLLAIIVFASPAPAQHRVTGSLTKQMPRVSPILVAEVFGPTLCRQCIQLRPKSVESIGLKRDSKGGSADIWPTDVTGRVR